MSGPARAGVFVYARDLQALAAFYQSVLGMSRAHSGTDLVVLSSNDLQIVVSAMPAQFSAEMEMAAPPHRREDAAYKFFYTVSSLSEAAETAAALGGEVLPEQWRGRGYVVQNAVDPEGNIFQLREQVG